MGELRFGQVLQKVERLVTGMVEQFARPIGDEMAKFIAERNALYDFVLERSEFGFEQRLHLAARSAALFADAKNPGEFVE